MRSPKKSKTLNTRSRSTSCTTTSAASTNRSASRQRWKPESQTMFGVSGRLSGCSKPRKREPLNDDEPTIAAICSCQKPRVIRLEGVDPEWLLQPSNRQKALDILSRNGDKIFQLLSPALRAKYAHPRPVIVTAFHNGGNRLRDIAAWRFSHAQAIGRPIL